MRFGVEARLGHREVEQVRRHRADAELLRDHRLDVRLARERGRDLVVLVPVREALDPVVDARMGQIGEHVPRRGDGGGGGGGRDGGGSGGGVDGRRRAGARGRGENEKKRERPRVHRTPEEHDCRQCAESDFAAAGAYGEYSPGTLPAPFSPSELSQNLWTHPS